MFGVEQGSSSDSSVTPATTKGDWCLRPPLSVSITARVSIINKRWRFAGACNLHDELRLLAQLICSVAELAEQLFDMSETFRVCLSTTLSSPNGRGQCAVRFNTSAAHPNGSFVAVDPGDSQPGGQVEHVLQNLLVELQVG